MFTLYGATNEDCAETVKAVVQEENIKTKVFPYQRNAYSQTF